MTSKICGIDVEHFVNDKYMIFSYCWGKLACYTRLVDAESAFKRKLPVPTKWPWQIPHGHIPTDQKLYKWNEKAREWQILKG